MSLTVCVYNANVVLPTVSCPHAFLFTLDVLALASAERGGLCCFLNVEETG